MMAAMDNPKMQRSCLPLESKTIIRSWSKNSKTLGIKRRSCPAKTFSGTAPGTKRW